MRHQAVDEYLIAIYEAYQVGKVDAIAQNSLDYLTRPAHARPGDATENPKLLGEAYEVMTIVGILKSLLFENIVVGKSFFHTGFHNEEESSGTKALFLMTPIWEFLSVRALKNPHL